MILSYFWADNYSFILLLRSVLPPTREGDISKCQLLGLKSKVADSFDLWSTVSGMVDSSWNYHVLWGFPRLSRFDRWVVSINLVAIIQACTWFNVSRCLLALLNLLAITPYYRILLLHRSFYRERVTSQQRRLTDEARSFVIFNARLPWLPWM